MEGDFLRNDLQSNQRQGLQQILTVLRDLNLLNDGNANNAAVARLVQLADDPQDAVQHEIDNFDFTVPDLTYDNMLQILGHRPLQKDFHYQDRNGIL